VVSSICSFKSPIRDVDRSFNGVNGVNGLVYNVGLDQSLPDRIHIKDFDGSDLEHSKSEPRELDEPISNS